MDEPEQETTMEGKKKQAESNMGRGQGQWQDRPTGHDE